MVRLVCYKNDKSINPKFHEVILHEENESITCEQIIETLDPKLEAFIIDDSELPGDRSELSAWSIIGNNAIVIDLNKFKEGTKNRLRGERTKLLADLDIQYIRAQEIGADTSAIVAEKQRLRDITNLVDPCTTVEELRALTVTSNT